MSLKEEQEYENLLAKLQVIRILIILIPVSIGYKLVDRALTCLGFK